MLELNHISKSYDATPVLQLDHFTIPQRETTVLIGPSGCGKTTLIRLIIGLIQPEQGEVRFDGTLLTPRNVARMRHRMGYVIQEGGLFPHLTAKRNVTLLADYLGRDSSYRDRRLAELAHLVRLPERLLDRYPAELSGGQRQRVALMRALMLDPDLLLLDEPLGALDPMIRYDLQGDLKAIFQALGKTVVMVTHDMGEAVFFGDTLVLMHDGQIIQQGTARELTERPASPFVERFLRAQRVSSERPGTSPK